MEHKYVPLTEITNDTLKELNFAVDCIPVLPDFKLAVTIHENLKRIATDKDLQKSIIVALCEMIVGNFFLHHEMPNDRPTLDIPGDFGYSGQVEVDFSDPKTVRIINLFGGTKKLN